MYGFFAALYTLALGAPLNRTPLRGCRFRSLHLSHSDPSIRLGTSSRTPAELGESFVVIGALRCAETSLDNAFVSSGGRHLGSPATQRLHPRTDGVLASSGMYALSRHRE